MNWKLIQAALIRAGWTFVLAFAAQPIVAGALDGEWQGITKEQVIAAAAAAALYAVKKLIWPDTTF